MCKYCEFLENGDKNYDDCYFIEKKFKHPIKINSYEDEVDVSIKFSLEYTVWLDLYHKKGKPVLSLEVFSDNEDKGWVYNMPIRYCPKCGRDLYQDKYLKEIREDWEKWRKKNEHTNKSNR